MEEEKPKRNALVPLLLALMLLLGFYAYKKTQDFDTLEQVFKQDKEELKAELDELIEDYKDLSVTKKSLSKRLIKEMNKIISLRDSVKKLKTSNYYLIKKYRKKIATLERENHDLFAQVDSLKVVNKTLKNENIVVIQELTDTKEKTAELKEYQKELKAKITVASKIKTTSIEAIAMKERSSGKLTSTSRSSRADAFRIKFTMLENKVTTPGNKKVHIQIMDSNKKIIAKKGVAKLKNGHKIAYSQELVADYRNDELGVLSLILVNRDDIHKGIYKINTFIEGNYTGSTTVKLR